jgi:hypothetical protein
MIFKLLVRNHSVDDVRKFRGCLILEEKKT